MFIYSSITQGVGCFLVFLLLSFAGLFEMTNTYFWANRQFYRAGLITFRIIWQRRSNDKALTFIFMQIENVLKLVIKSWHTLIQVFLTCFLWENSAWLNWLWVVWRLNQTSERKKSIYFKISETTVCFFCINFTFLLPGIIFSETPFKLASHRAKFQYPVLIHYPNDLCSQWAI